MAGRTGRRGRVAPFLIVGLLIVSGCGGNADLGGGPHSGSITGYQTASMFSPAGHSVSAGENGTVRVRGAGSPETPPERVEKIARARAAAYGVEQRKTYFRAEVAGESILCGKKTSVSRGETVKRPARGYHVVDLDVTYSKSPDGPDYQKSHDVAKQLKAELASEVPSAEALAAARAPVAAQCGLDN